MFINAIMPMYKQMDAPCVHSLVAFVMDINHREDDLKITFSMCQNVCMARNAMLHEIVERYDKGEPVDYILTLDHDHDYSATALYGMIDKIEKNNLPGLSANYYQRGNRKFHVMLEDPVKHELYNPTKIENPGINECHACGFGFFVFKTETIKNILLKDKLPFAYDENKYTSEDVRFCRIMRECGYKVYFDADTIVGHYMSCWNR